MLNIGGSGPSIRKERAPPTDVNTRSVWKSKLIGLARTLSWPKQRKSIYNFEKYLQTPECSSARSRFIQFYIYFTSMQWIFDFFSLKILLFLKNKEIQNNAFQNH